MDSHIWPARIFGLQKKVTYGMRQFPFSFFVGSFNLKTVLNSKDIALPSLSQSRNTHSSNILSAI